MLIVCPSCATSYQVEPHSLGENGRSVRCAPCHNVWFATLPATVATLPGSDAWDVVDTGPRVPAVDVPPAPSTPAFAATDGIDVAGLRAELNDVAREEEADAVLAEVARDSAAPIDAVVTDSPPLAPTEDNASETASPVASESETLAQRRVRLRAKRRKPAPKFGLPALILL